MHLYLMKLILMNQQQMTVQIWGIGTQLPTHLLIKCMERNTNKLGFIRTPCVFPLPLGTSFTVRHAWKIIFHTGSLTASGSLILNPSTLCLFISRGQWKSNFKTNRSWRDYGEVVLLALLCFRCGLLNMTSETF